MARKTGHGRIPEIRKKSRHNPEVPDLPGPPPRGLFEQGEWQWIKEPLLGPNAPPGPVAFEISGKIGQTVYQRAGGPGLEGKLSNRKMIQVRRHVMPRDPRTHEQLLVRARFQAAVRAACLLGPQEVEAYKKRVKRGNLKLNWDNLFIREFIRKHPLHEFQMEAEALRIRQDIGILIPVIPEVMLMNWQKIHEAQIVSPADYIISGLDGDFHGAYLVVLSGLMEWTAAAKVVGLRPNGALTGYGTPMVHYLYCYDPTTFGFLYDSFGTTKNILPLARQNWNGGHFLAHGFLNAKKGVWRHIRGTYRLSSTLYPANAIIGDVGGTWQNIADNITSLVLHFDGATEVNVHLMVFAAKQ